MCRERARDFIKHNVSLVTLPELVNELIDKVNNPNCSLDAIADVLRKDPALAARLLRIVNSPMYGFRAEIDTISRAIAIVGIDHLRDIVLATTVINCFNTIPSKYISIKLYWRHCLYCAIAAKNLAQHLKFPETERFFVMGLLHDIGKLVMYSCEPEKSDDVARLSIQMDVSQRLVESQIFGLITKR